MARRIRSPKLDVLLTEQRPEYRKKKTKKTKCIVYLIACWRDPNYERPSDQGAKEMLLKKTKEGNKTKMEINPTHALVSVK